MEEQRNRQVETLVEQLKAVLESSETKKQIQDILQPIQSLMALPSTNMRLLTAASASASTKRRDYRLAWVGSDDALCHLGTGLHKVPLARLEEVFLSLLGGNRVLLQEVIRILGPFPNVKNTLAGSCSTTTTATSENDSFVTWTLSYESMVDGTGKELLAGKEENVRFVDLQVLFSDESILVAVVPPERATRLQSPPEQPQRPQRRRGKEQAVQRMEPLEQDGKFVLVFMREPDMNVKLEKLRVV